jgi:hypothetical protein
MAQRLATIAEIRGIAPEFGAVDDLTPTVSDAFIETWSRIAARFIGLARWGDDASDGHALLTAHLISVDPNSGLEGAGGPLASAAVGPVSTSFVVPPLVDELLSTSHYGRAYMALRQVVQSLGTGVVSSTRYRQG